MTNSEFLLITLVLYIMGINISYRFNNQLFMLISILWLIPLTLIDNNIIKIFSTVMFITHIIIPLANISIGGDIQ